MLLSLSLSDEFKIQQVSLRCALKAVSPSCGKENQTTDDMGPAKILNPKGKWKEVAIDPNLYANAEMENFVSFEELTDYEFVDGELRITEVKFW